MTFTRPLLPSFVNQLASPQRIELRSLLAQCSAEDVRFIEEILAIRSTPKNHQPVALEALAKTINKRIESLSKQYE